MVHFPASFADRNAIFTDGKVIFVFCLDAPFFIEINKWDDAFSFAVFIDGHGIMCRIQEPFPVLEIWQESFRPEI